jgi:dTDP-4-dehydrorhamnose 3,5-epimerase-like enzyme
MAYIITLPTFRDSRGSLTVAEKNIPFSIQRVYYILDVPDAVTRGGHRHKKNIQALFCIKGSCVISINDGHNKDEFLLDRPEKCLILETKDWHTMHSFTEDAILFVLASEPFDVSDYIDKPYP